MYNVASVSFTQFDPTIHKPVFEFDNTKLTAYNTCPTWGVLRYGLHKVMTVERNQHLDAGSAAHEFFASVRLCELLYYQKSEALFHHHALRLFGADRFDKLQKHLQADRNDEVNRLNFCLEALYTSGFEDSPEEKYKTMSNIEEACISYFDRYPWGKWPIWIRDPSPTSDVGIEVGFDINIEMTKDDASTIDLRFVGRVDGIHMHDGFVVPHENKTAGRLTDSWRNSFEMAHQVTGYCLATSVFTGAPCHKAVLRGLQIPLPKSHSDGVTSFIVTRPSHMFTQWLTWMYHTVQIARDTQLDPITAPKYTHSCNRFFSSCQFVPFCTAALDEKQQMLHEMEVSEWHPLR